MIAEQVKALAADGQEVGGHTRTRPHLPTLTLELLNPAARIKIFPGAIEQESEIADGRQDLMALGINAKSFAYPYGEHNEDTLTAYLLQGYSVRPETTFEEIRQRHCAGAKSRIMADPDLPSYR